MSSGSRDSLDGQLIPRGAALHAVLDLEGFKKYISQLCGEENEFNINSPLQLHGQEPSIITPIA